MALELAGAFRSYGNTRNNSFSSCNWKKAQETNTFVKVTDLHPWQRADWWASTLSLGELLFTGSQQHWLSAIYQKKEKKPTKKPKEKSLRALHRAALHSSGERREVINGMLQSSIWLGLSRRFPFGKPAFGAWAAGTQEPHCVGYSASWAGKPTRSCWLAAATSDFP